MGIKGTHNLMSKAEVAARQTAKYYAYKSKAISTDANKTSGKTAGTAGVKKNSSTSTLPTKASSTTSQGNSQTFKKQTTYVADAAVIYTSSGSVSAYACGGTRKQARKDPSESSISCNRPSISYQEQFAKEKSVKADKQKDSTYMALNKPVSSAVPKKKTDTKKNASAIKKSDQRKEYMPSDSRNGAGKAYYGKKTSPSGAKEGASFCIGFIPGVGDAKDIQEAVTGRDWITGKKLDKVERVMTGVSACIPIISGSSIRTAKKGVKYGSKLGKKKIKKAAWKKSGQSGKRKKAIKKAIGKGTEEVRKKDTGKLKKKTKEPQKSNAGKKTEKQKNGKVYKGDVAGKSGSKTGNPVIDNMKNKVPNNEVTAPSKKGNAPISNKDGEPIEIHHNEQEPLGPFNEMHPSDHRYGDNYKKNHPNYNKRSKIDRIQFGKWKREYWEKEWENGRWN